MSMGVEVNRCNHLVGLLPQHNGAYVSEAPSDVGALGKILAENGDFLISEDENFFIATESA